MNSPSLSPGQKLERSRRRLAQIETALRNPNLDPAKRGRLLNLHEMQSAALRLREGRKPTKN